MFSTHVSIRGTKNDWPSSEVLCLSDLRLSWFYSAPLKKCVVSLSDFTSLRVSLNLFLPRLLVISLMSPNSSILFSLKNSYCWRSVISCRLECHQRSTRPFGMESMLFSLSHHIKKIPLRTCHICHDHWHFLFSLDSYCRPIRMGRYSKCWNGACFLPSFPSLRMT